jgi:alpha-ribazole phosphatase
MKIYLIRHTAVDVPQGMCYGHTDVPLKDTFETEAAIVKENLKQIQPEAVFSSPLSRCAKLADFCGFNDVTFDNRLKELNFGDWEKQQWDKIDMSIWETDWMNPPTPNGESFVQMYQRVTSFLNELKEKPFDKVFIFTHSGIISCARVYFGQADINKTFELMPDYGEVVEFGL